MKFRGKQVVVAVTSGDAERRTGDAHAGTLDVAGVNAIAESDVSVTARADIAYSGKAGAEGKPRILHAGDRFARNRDAKPRVAAIRGIAGEMGVNIDEA